MMQLGLLDDVTQLISTATQSDQPVACLAAARALETVQPDALYRDPLAETLAGADAMVYVRNTSMGQNPKVRSAKCTHDT
jgi:O-methyltransferase involved in polyketide biosynthesis